MAHPGPERLAHFLLPRSCFACFEDLPPPLAGPLCGACLPRLKPMQPPWCGRCGRQRRASASCQDCGGEGLSIEPIRAAFPYRDLLPGLLHAFKYGGQKTVGRALAGWMAGLLPRFPELAGADAVVAVPLHPKRMAERGFNQAETLARACAAAYRRPLLDALARAGETSAQWRLTRGERSENLRGAFAARAGARLAGRSFLLIDDVCTTGRTLDSCAKTLKAAGAAKVMGFVLARD